MCEVVSLQERDPGDPLDGQPLCRLARAAQGGCRDSLDRLVERLLPQVAATARLRMTRTLRRRYEARDVSQFAWVALLDHLRRIELRSDGALRAWLARFVAHRAVDLERRLRTQAADVLREVPLDGEPRGDAPVPSAFVAREPDPVEACFRQAAVADWMVLVDQLDDEQRDVFVAIALDGCTHAAAAQLLGISETTVGRRFAAARARLARELASRGVDGHARRDGNAR